MQLESSSDPEGAYMGWKSGICVLESTAGASYPTGLHARHAVALIRKTDREGTARTLSKR